MLQGFGRFAQAQAEALQVCHTTMCDHPSGFVRGQGYSGWFGAVQDWAGAAVQLITAAKRLSAKGLGLYQPNRQTVRSPLFGVMFFKAQHNV